MSHVSIHAIPASNGQRATMKTLSPDCPTGLRMYLHPGGKRTQVSLEGDLAGGWVQNSSAAGARCPARAIRCT